MKNYWLLALLIFPSMAFAQVSHPNSDTASACYTDHDDVHFFAIGGGCAGSEGDDYHGYAEVSDSDCFPGEGAQLIEPGGSHCLVEDSEGFLWALEKGLTSEAGIGACGDAGDFSGPNGCSVSTSQPTQPVPVAGPLGLVALIMGLLVVGGRRLVAKK